jgi:hypothetical protein
VCTERAHPNNEQSPLYLITCVFCKKYVWQGKFDFQMAGRQIRRIAALTCENHNQFCVASPLVRISMWYTSKTHQ